MTFHLEVEGHVAKLYAESESEMTVGMVSKMAFAVRYVDLIVI